MNISDLTINDKEAVSLKDVFLDDKNHKVIEQLIKEHKYVDALSKYKLPVNNKILLQGNSGCGKTITAKAIAHTLNKNIIILNLSNVVCARIGETSQNIKQVFDKAGREKAVLFLDEFDQIGKARGRDDKDVGEMRRLVNTIIQLMDYFPNNAFRTILPIFLSNPAFEVGIPVSRANFCFACVIPKARFKENDTPGILNLDISL